MSYRKAYYNGKELWCGAINVLDGVIEETHDFNTARDNEFHHSFYFRHPEKIGSGECAFFYIDKDKNGNTNVFTQWREDRNDAIERKLRSMLDLSDNTDYSEDGVSQQEIVPVVDDTDNVDMQDILSGIKELGQ